MKKLKMYYLGQYIKTIKVDKNENVFNNVYEATILFKKHLFGTNLVNAIFIPVRQLKTHNKVIYAEVEIYRGVNR